MKKLTILMVVLVLGAACVFASDYYIENYDVQVTLGNNAIHHITETIDVYFEGPHHGIIREIPIDYSSHNGMRVEISNLESSEEYDSEVDNGYLVLRLGSASRTVTGLVRYILSYDYDIGEDTNEGYDEFYFNVIGTDWECRIDNITYSIEIPYVESSLFENYDAFSDYVFENSYFTRGSYGSTDDNLDVWFYAYKDKSAVLFKATDTNLLAYQGETVRLQFPDSWYQGARQRWDNRPTMAIISPVVTILLCAIAMLIWSKYGKDKTPVVVARWTAPEGLSPLMVGFVADSSVDDKDVISMLFYWADQGLLSISKVDEDKYEFTKLKEIMDYAIENGKNIEEHEIALFNGFFKGCSVGDTITFDQLEENDFFSTITKTKIKTASYFKKDKALADKNSKIFSSLLIFVSLFPLILGILRFAMYENAPDIVFLPVLGALFLFAFNLFAFTFLFNRWYIRKNNIIVCILSSIPTIVITALYVLAESATDVQSPAIWQCVLSVVGSSLIMVFGVITERRSEYGNKILEEILGFREFIEKVEIDKLKMLIEEDPQIYYHILSYALVLGLEDKWAKKFKDMIVSPPVWYTSSDPFTVYYMASIARSMYRTIPMASVPKSEISSSPGARIGGGGFNSSGFSGGGFGGGGGRAW